MLLMLPWLAGVIAASIYDHHRAIERMVDLRLADPVVPGVQAAVHWLAATARYSGDAILLYGILPAGLTFILYVLFLPWADRWSRRGLLEE